MEPKNEPIIIDGRYVINIPYKKEGLFLRTYYKILEYYYVFFKERFLITKKVEQQTWYCILSDNKRDFTWTINPRQATVFTFFASLICRYVIKKRNGLQIELMSYGDAMFTITVFNPSDNNV